MQYTLLPTMKYESIEKYEQRSFFEENNQTNLWKFLLITHCSKIHISVLNSGDLTIKTLTFKEDNFQNDYFSSFHRYGFNIGVIHL
jgi:hypothetical protein